MNVFFSIRMNSKQVIDELNNNNCIKLALERMDVVVDCLIWHIKLMYLREKKIICFQNEPTCVHVNERAN